MKKIRYLVEGPKFNQALDKRLVTFTQSLIPPDSNDVVIDVSEKQDGTIVTWYDRKRKTQFIYSEYSILMNKNSAAMFMACYKAKHIDISYMDPYDVEDLSYAFSWCKRLNLVYCNMSLSYINNDGKGNALLLPSSMFHNIKNMSYMYADCRQMKEIDCTTFDMSECNTECIFENCNKLCSLTKIKD